MACEVDSYLHVNAENSIQILLSLCRFTSLIIYLYLFAYISTCKQLYLYECTYLYVFTFLCTYLCKDDISMVDC